MFRRFKVRIINPKLMTVAHSDARRIAFYFAPEFVRRLEPDSARAQDRLLHHPDASFFLKGGLRAPVLANPCDKILEITLGKRCTFPNRCQYYKGKRHKH